MTGIVFHYGAQLRASVKALADMAFREDLPHGDITAKILKLDGQTARAQLVCREEAVMCGAAWYRQILKAFEAETGFRSPEVQCFFEDGQRVPAGSVLFSWHGNTAAIVALERPFLNFLGRGVGIAKCTRGYVDLVRKHNQRTQILDTRKTLPGYRYFDKYAVLCGGGQNHRMHLGDQVLIKENHIARWGGVTNTLAQVCRGLPKQTLVQIEVQNLAELQEAIEAACPLIMLDNFSPAQVSQACELERGESLLEVSGGIVMANLAKYCHPRLDRISIGALTHSVKAPDLSLLIEETQP